MMNVMKFFRRHNRKMLGVLMALLMIVFLGGSALESWMRPQTNAVIAQTRLGAITDFDREFAKSSTELLESVGFRWSEPLPGTPEPLSTIDWIMLNREAAQLGTKKDAGAIRNLLGDKTLADRIDLVSRQRRVKVDHIIEAIGQYQSIIDAARGVATAAFPSEADIRNVARLGLEKVKVQVVMLPSLLFTNSQETFSQEELEAQFNRYKDKFAGSGMDFGYRIGPAAKVQYIKVDRGAIGEKIGIANPEVKARKYWEEQRESNPLFFKTPDELDKDKATPNPDGTPKPAYKDWESAKETALRLSRQDQADQAAKRIADWLIGHLSDPWLGVETGEDQFKKPPAGASDVEAYAAAIKRIPASMAFADSVRVGETDFFTEETAAKLPDGLAKAVVPAERQHSASLLSLAMKTKGIVKEIPREKGVNPADYLVPFQTSPYPLQDNLGNVYVLRVLETRDARSPSSVDEVRDKVIANLQVARGYQAALVRAQGMLGCSPDGGLKLAYESDEELVAIKGTGKGFGSGYFEPPPFSRTFVLAAARGSREAMTFVQGGVGPIPRDVADKCFDLEHAPDKTIVAELPERAAVLVIQWVETVRVPEDEYLKQRDQIVRDINSARAQAAIADWLSTEKVRARNEFQPASNRG